MERAVGKNEKLESFKLESLKLESFCLSLKEPNGKKPNEVGKNQAKLGKPDRSWKVSYEVNKLLLKLENFAGVGKFRFS